ncbi:hypothetical protein BDQ17DRAFT_111239 [Cyathus striatus]|nr:hypothetical protein BDQ17DRAFT_111239 [Cyathus striatus]
MASWSCRSREISHRKNVAVRLQEEGKLGASYFFSRTDPATNNVSRLFATIAYKLAISSESPDLRNAVEAKIEHDPSIVQQSMEIQWKKLIVDPLKEVSGNGVNIATSVILIDGLDECENDESQLELLELLDEANLKIFHSASLFLVGQSRIFRIPFLKIKRSNMNSFVRIKQMRKYIYSL